jgi:hypothetical protein
MTKTGGRKTRATVTSKRQRKIKYIGSILHQNYLFVEVCYFRQNFVIFIYAKHIFRILFTHLTKKEIENRQIKSSSPPYNNMVNIVCENSRNIIHIQHNFAKFKTS